MRRLSISCLLLVTLLASNQAFCDDTVTIELTIRNHVFTPVEVKAPLGRPLILKIKNEDASPEEFESSTLRVEKIITGQGEITVRLKPPKAGRYNFVGEYHQETAHGVLIVE